MWLDAVIGMLIGVATALTGPLLFVPGFGLLAIIGFGVPLLLTGIGFGVFNGYMVKRLEAQ